LKLEQLKKLKKKYSNTFFINRKQCRVENIRVLYLSTNFQLICSHWRLNWRTLSSSCWSREEKSLTLYGDQGLIEEEVMVLGETSIVLVIW
jgi:hypothetical protein